MNIKHLILIFVASACVACNPKDMVVPGMELSELAYNDWLHVHSDTIPQPNNPLAPPAENTITIQGELLYLPRVEGAAVKSRNMYLLYTDGPQKLRFDDSMLEGLYLGDTIAVTGYVYAKDNYGAYCMRTKNITLVAPYKDRQDKE